MSNSTSNLQSLLMRARSEIRMSQCTVCGRHGYNPNPDCSTCVERLALENDLLSFPVETTCSIRPHDYCSAGTCSVCMDASRYRFLRQSEASLSPEQEGPYGAAWGQIRLKGVDAEKMDAIIDDALRAVLKT